MLKHTLHDSRPLMPSEAIPVMPSEDPPKEWWRIDPRSGAPISSDSAGHGIPVSYLGDGPLADAAMVAMNIDATFGSSRYFTDEEARLLLTHRVVPGSVRPYADAAAELVEAVDDLWALVDESYQEAWGRAANDVERRLIADYAFSIIRGEWRESEGSRDVTSKPPGGT